MATILERLARAEARIRELDGKVSDAEDAVFESLKRVDRVERLARLGQRWVTRTWQRLQLTRVGSSLYCVRVGVVARGG